MKEYFWGDTMYISLDEALLRILFLLGELDRPDKAQEGRIYRKIFCETQGGDEDEQE